MKYIGIDPGKKGGFAIIDVDLDCGEVCEPRVYVQLMNDKDFMEFMKSCSVSKCKCCLEEVHAMPKQGVSSTFSFGEGYGFLKGVLECLGISYQTISPRRWKGEFGLNSEKKKSIEVCQRLFPDVSLLPTERSRVPSDGMAESLLMAEYARRRL